MHSCAAWTPAAADAAKAVKKNSSHNHSKKVALGGICAALSLVIMFAGGFLPLSTFSAPILASLLLVPLTVELDGKTTLLCYAAVAILSLLIVPDREVVLLFLLLTGYYPVLQPHFLKVSFKPLRTILKLVLFNVSIVLTYIILLFLLVSPAIQQEFAENALWFWILSLFVANVLFVLYDILIDKVRIIYIHQIRKKFFKQRK